MKTKFVFITGGVISSIGKGLLCSALGSLLKSKGYKVSLMKLDPYVNVDPGTLSPLQHGEVYVTADGSETDLDLGNYERFTYSKTSYLNVATTGSIYQSVINKERSGYYDGKTVQIVPHITNEIKDRISRLACNDRSDIVLVEVGGTIGDIESLPFLEAVRQFSNEVGKENRAIVHVSLVPELGSLQEQKTKPTQHSVKDLRSLGLQPDILVCRSESSISEETKEKLSLFCDVSKESIISARDVNNIYEIPIALDEEGLSESISVQLELNNSSPLLSSWKSIQNKIQKSSETVSIGIVGKYTELSDAYLSLVEAIKHASIDQLVNSELIWIDSSSFNEEDLINLDGIIVPGGFGDRGIEGKVNASRIARENNIPFLGICLGLQCIIIDWGTNVAKLADVNSREFDSSCLNPVIDLMPGQVNIEKVGGTQRRGTYPTKLLPNSKSLSLYNQEVIYERHRHRYEINNYYRGEMQSDHYRLAGLSLDGNLIEIVEHADYDFFIGTQFHPEFNSYPNQPHPIFSGLISSAKRKK